MCYLAMGAFLVRAKAAGTESMQALNKFTFRAIFPFMMFSNVYSASPEDMPSGRLILFCVAGLFALVALLMAAVPRIVRENPRRGVIIQGIFRSNFVIYGLPLTIGVYGNRAASVTGVLVMIMVSLFNILGVVVLEIFREGGRVRIGPLLKELVKNPLLQGCAAGLLFFALGIRLPKAIEGPVTSLGAMAPPWR